MKWQALSLQRLCDGVPLALLAVFAACGWKTIWPEIVDAGKVRGLWQEKPRHACYWNSTTHETERVLARVAEQPGTVAFFNWRGRDALPARQDRMAAAYFLCPRPLPEALGQVPGTPDWIFRTPPWLSRWQRWQS